VLCTCTPKAHDPFEDATNPLDSMSIGSEGESGPPFSRADACEEVTKSSAPRVDLLFRRVRLLAHTCPFPISACQMPLTCVSIACFGVSDPPVSRVASPFRRGTQPDSACRWLVLANQLALSRVSTPYFGASVAVSAFLALKTDGLRD
jgi:hypothetical protein